MSKSPHIVTDHAVLRYLERVYGVDVSALRRRIERATSKARTNGANAANVDGVHYKISTTGRVMTVTGTNGKTRANRAARWKRKRS